ncbi:hypothetical protein ACFL3G_07315 [Planctomycetota bacterium]
MKRKFRNNGFSLSEVLLAVSTLAVGLVLVAGVFPVAIHFTTTACERTIAAVVADEAFATIRLYADRGIDYGGFTAGRMWDFNDANIFPATLNMLDSDFAYGNSRQYYWSAICRRTATNSESVQVTVFVCRKIGSGTKYWVRDTDPSSDELLESDFPRPVYVKVDPTTGASDELEIKDMVESDDAIEEKTFINDGYLIVDDQSGRIYRVQERYVDSADNRVLLERNWVGSSNMVWVVPSPVNGGRNPCIGVYQRIIRF